MAILTSQGFHKGLQKVVILRTLIYGVMQVFFCGFFL